LLFCVKRRIFALLFIVFLIYFKDENSKISKTPPADDMPELWHDGRGTGGSKREADLL